MLKRNINCGEVSESFLGKDVIVNGWIQRKRDLGNLLFIDLRDRSGIVQIVLNIDTINTEMFDIIRKLKLESVIGAKGKVQLRLDENPNLPTGKYEIIIEECEVFSPAEDLPFNPFSQQEVDEVTRLRYRYLDLRRPEARGIFELRSKITHSVRNFLISKDFIEVETPILTKSTPEGARDFLVPSRVNKGKFYALPQSPQLFKQILMMSGFERYFQIARCFRDEDLRQDRQPEFTQIDIEMSFIERDDILRMMEEMYKFVFKENMGIDIETPFPRLQYHDAKMRYGTDKPDTRFDMEIADLTDDFKDTKIQIIRKGIEEEKRVLSLFLENGVYLTRKEIEEIEREIKEIGLSGFIEFRVKDRELVSPHSKFLTDKEKDMLLNRSKNGDMIMIFVVDKKIGYDLVGRVRLYLRDRFHLVRKDLWNFLWIVDFPFFAYNEEEKRYEAEHHPFTMPKLEDLDRLESDPESVKAIAYDLVLNGNELGGGSVRISNPEIQRRVFRAIGLTDEEAEEKFGFLLKALRSGAPPHGGIAFGMDRLIWLLSNAGSLRDVIAFPKTTSAVCPLTNAPDKISKRQIEELGIEIKAQNL